MDIDLKTLALTLALGAIIIHQLHRLVVGSWREWKPSFYNVEACGGHFMQAAIAVAFCFAIGIVAEGLSKSVSSESDSFINRVLTRIIDPDSELRTRCLFESITKATNYSDGNSPEDGRHIVPSRLFYEIMYALRHPQRDNIATGNYFSDIFWRLDKEFDFSIMPEIPKKDKNTKFISGKDFDTLKDDINRVYYFSHNLTYQNDNYSRELIEIEKGMDFARSLAFAMFILGILTLMLLAVRLILDHRHNLLPEKHKKNFQKLDSYAGMCRIFLLCAFLFFCSRTAYHSEARNYNRRVFGYAEQLLIQGGTEKL